MNKKLLLAIGLIPLVIILAIVFNNRDAPSSATDSKRQLSELQSIEEGFMEAEVFINAQAPIKIDDQTRLEKALAGPGDMITYFYTLTTVSVAEVEPATVLEKIKPKLLSSLCKNAEMQPVLQAGAKIVYVYSDKNSEDVGRIEVVAADCQASS
ncbi:MULTISPECIES: hypothetical protein [unclassified Methylophaga]|uniref:hypothetical protein n=1 Tax=unclassified Methylophaga TaxID=2629249 RepID=UPI000C9104FD|nr:MULTISPECIES: hypothetical protein [unclassified Methylophaga]MBN47833.1 hypothetical protein [Methylophaga sp.]|tara:strand:- start:65402 stop:65863 length:462 start_codon:yes stop_codon:yes gene_type:complete